MKHLALILILAATPTVAQEQAIQVEKGEFLCASPQDALDIEESCIQVEKPAFYTVVRQVKSNDTPHTFRCVRPIERTSGECRWIQRYR